MGKLFLVATPIGNLGDLSPRAQLVLKGCQVIVAESRAHSLKLFELFELGKKNWIEMGRHNEKSPKVWSQIFKALNKNDVAIISDGGSPSVSDPGSWVVSEAHRAHIEVEIIPGPSSVISAYQWAGNQDSNGFVFHGFLNHWKKSELKARLSQGSVSTHVLFLSPHRGAKEIQLLKELVPHAYVSLCFEITKMHQRIIQGHWNEIENQEILWKGECVAVLELASGERTSDPTHKESLASQLWEIYYHCHEMSPKDFSRKYAENFGFKANDFYRLGLYFKDHKT